MRETTAESGQRKHPEHTNVSGKTKETTRRIFTRAIFELDNKKKVRK